MDAGSPRPETKRGNPRFRDPEYQRTQAARRWEGHISKARAKLIIAGLVELEVEKAQATARQYIGVPPEDDLEDWEPLTLEDIEGKEYDEYPFCTEQSLRDKLARKAAREKRQEPTE